MSPVQCVTDVPVHSSLRRLGYLAGRGAQKDALAVVFWGGRCGQGTGPLRWVTDDGAVSPAAVREETSSLCLFDPLSRLLLTEAIEERCFFSGDRSTAINTRLLRVCA
jgi:hypothetical protein